MPAITALSCPASDGSTFTANGATFNIHCGIDYYGNDIGRAGDAQTFEQCITICSTTSGCVDVNWTNGNCYLKNAAVNSIADDSAWTATLASTDTANALRIHCPRDDGTSYTTPSGDVYLISCDQNYPDGDYTNSYVSSFEQCIANCDNDARCTDFSYHHSFCYLKNKVTTLQPEEGTWSAKLVSATISCPRSDNTIYTADDGKQYLISCRTDFYGGDLSNYYETSFENCIKTCDATPGCIDLSYHHKFCYMKNVQTAASFYEDSWSAQLISSVSCPASDGTIYTTSSGDRFQIQCATDYYGGDLSSYYERSFENCIKTCDTTAGCVDVAYHHSFCYMKDGSVSATPDSGSWAAKKLPNSK